MIHSSPKKTRASHNALIPKHQAIFLSNETYLILPPKKTNVTLKKKSGVNSQMVSKVFICKYTATSPPKVCLKIMFHFPDWVDMDIFSSLEGEYVYIFPSSTLTPPGKNQTWPDATTHRHQIGKFVGNTAPITALKVGKLCSSKQVADVIDLSWDLWVDTQGFCCAWTEKTRRSSKPDRVRGEETWCMCFFWDANMLNWCKVSNLFASKNKKWNISNFKI